MMGLTQASIFNAKEIQAAVQRVEEKFAGQVKYIRYTFEDNSFGEPSIFFWVVVNDEVSEMDKFSKLTYDVSIALMNEAQTDERGVRAYYDFRSWSEQQELKSPEWA